ncbi:apolipoprotein acyltransferase [Rhodopirellula bahusiensis]|uniref:Apolipoprotein acyltransferase n=1 Tax=Rhodopirellula bahusiensis TaxID=2014065 RepID=A0A2G1W714_9BACT|nr:apolipoprotein acyltransferase [Rhodopirellula bahusiensis]PHQ34834.1 apolipoprotein acyltransferase [Rhodopirellula bahusiensis]
MQPPSVPAVPPDHPGLEALLRRMGEAVGIMDDSVFENDKFVGFFQSFRPDGRGLDGVFERLDCGDELQQRLEKLFEVAGDDRRPQGGRDAFFLARSPKPIDPKVVESKAVDWTERMAAMAETLGEPEAADRLRAITKHRVLEGIPPKHPKQAHEKTELLKTFQNVVENLVCQIATPDPFAETLRPPYYFVSCDAGVRDHLMWPLYRDHVEVEEPFQPYFDLWSHGVKFRVYQENQVDWYMPRL